MPQTATGEIRSGKSCPAPSGARPREAPETFAKARDSAAGTYGEGQRAHRVAYSALKHKFEKKVGRWVPKGHKGPSGPRAADLESRENHGKSYGGVDRYGSTKEELRKRAAEFGVRGRPTMTREQLAEAIARKQG